MVLHGPEEFLRAEYTSQLRKALTAEHGEVDVIRFDGDSAPLADVLDECRSFGLLAAHKMVVVDQADMLLAGDNRPLVERYANAPAEGATLVLRSSRWNKGKLDARIGEIGVICKCDQVDPAMAARWVIKRAEKAHQVVVPQQVAAMLVDRVGAGLGKLDSELGKLAAAAGPEGTVTPELITDLVGASREEDMWSIQAELLCGNPERTLLHLHRILDNGPRNTAVPVSFACCDLARKLLGVCAGIESGANPFEAAKAVKIWGPSRDPILAAARRTSVARARELFDDCVRADVAQKSGLGTPVRTLERIVLRFAAVLA